MKGPLYIAEDQARALISMADALKVLSDAFALPCTSAALDKTNLPRQRADLPGGFFNVMAATLPPWDVFGLKAYYRSEVGGGYHVLLYSMSEGRLVAVIEADYLSQLRTGAASGLAAKHMARSDAREMALIGTGKQAFWQISAVAAVRPIRRVRINGRNLEKAQALADRVEKELAIEAVAVSSAEDCVRGADIVGTITTSATPVCRAEWVSAGTHLNVAGANTAARQELETDLMLRAGVLATDNIEQARLEAAEFRELDRLGCLDWGALLTLDALCAGAAGRRSYDEITVFKSLGVAIEDVALASLLYQRIQADTAAIPTSRKPQE